MVFACPLKSDIQNDIYCYMEKNEIYFYSFSNICLLPKMLLQWSQVTATTKAQQNNRKQKPELLDIF